MKRFLLITALCLAAMVFFASTASAQTFDWADSFRSANTAYNAEKYDEAQKLYVRAIQADPSRPDAYRNLARTYFWLDKYASAVLNYDHYLRLAPSATDVEQIKSERRLAGDRAGEAVWTMPDPQRLTLAALNKSLEGGAAFTEGGGGAWGLYQTLLRTDYAQPDLTQIRNRLSRRLIDEYEAALAVETGQPVPVLDLSLWQVQMERLSNARAVALDPAMREVVDRRATIAEAALALLTGQSSDAVGLARLARESNPDFPFVRWYEIVALIEAEQLDEAKSALETFARTLADSDPAALDYARVLRAEVLRRQEKREDAADLFWTVVQP